MEDQIGIIVDKFLQDYNALQSDLSAHAHEAGGSLAEQENWDRVCEAFGRDLRTLKTQFIAQLAEAR